MPEAVSTTSPSNDRFSHGSERFAAVTGFPAKLFLDNLDRGSPDFGRYVIEWVFGDVYRRDDLDLTTRELVIIAAGAALGATGIDVLKFHIPNAIRAGATRVGVGAVAGLRRGTARAQREQRCERERGEDGRSHAGTFPKRRDHRG